MSISGVYETEQVSRKEYRCDSCNKPIRKGSFYTKETHYMGPTFRYHYGGGLGQDGCDIEFSEHGYKEHF